MSRLSLKQKLKKFRSTSLPEGWKKEYTSYSVLRGNRTMFSDFWGPRIFGVNFTETRYYQIPWLLVDDGNVSSGRQTGKSKVLNLKLLYDEINTTNEERFLATFRDAHVNDRQRDLEMAHNQEPFFMGFLMTGKIRGSVIKEAVKEWRFIHGGYLFLANVGDAKVPASILGKSPVKRYLEEAGVFPSSAWSKFFHTRSPKGCNDFFVGTCDVVMTGSPLYLADTIYDKFKGGRFHTSKRMEANFSISDFNEAKKQGGEHSDNFKSLIDAEFTTLSTYAWDIRAVEKCFKDVPEYRRTTLNPETIGDKKPHQLFYDLPQYIEGDTYTIFMDPAGTQASLIGVFRGERLIFRVELIEKVILPIQADILDYLMTYYNANFAGIDCTWDPSIADSLIAEVKDEYKGKNYKDRIVSFTFQQRVVTGYDIHPDDGDKLEHMQRMVEKKEMVKDLAIRLLANDLANGVPVLPRSDEAEIKADFESEVEKRSILTGKPLLYTPSNVHFPEMMRVRAYTRWVKTGQQPEKPGKKSSGIAMPEFGKRIWG